MSVSLVGIVAVQIYLLDQAIKVSDSNFRSVVSQALNDVVNRLQEAEMEATVFKVSRNLNIDLRNDIIFDDESRLRRDQRYVINFRVNEDDRGNKQRSLALRDTLKEYIRLEGKDTTLTQNRARSFTYNENDSLESMPLVQGDLEIETHPKLIEIFQQTIDAINSLDANIAMRVDSTQLDTLLRNALNAQGLDLAYQFMVTTENSTQPIFASNKASSKRLFTTPHKVLLFPHQQTVERSYLHAFFPDQRGYNLRSVAGLAIASLGFSSIILVSFLLTIRAIFRQKRLSQMKNDFINNMTHELKTPIATISLATDSLRNPMIQTDPTKVDRYMHIIKEENQRMNRQVERVLQAARFDRGEIRMKPELLSVNNLIEETTSKFRLQIEQRSGNLDLNLSADTDQLYGDKVHLSNVISNLLDNANKYSPQSPQILVQSLIEADEFVFRVSDEGIGISKADLAHIFDRFYRVSNGDLHEVKGFGLGLSYVKEVVEIHGGTIKVVSRLNKGSTFEVRLPLQSES